MCAQEAIQGLLAKDSALPLKGKDIKWVKDASFTPLDTYASSETRRDVTPPASQAPPTPAASHTSDKGPSLSAGNVATGNWPLLTMSISLALCLL
ncbi:hypothetical protein E4U58_001978 [Claviceps cyperi]|nr:hypothetical protein E4U58_001978 [Claviceps cyperi]